jgi:hypothetical protein
MTARILLFIILVAGCATEPTSQPASPPPGPAQPAPSSRKKSTPAPPMETLARGDDAVWEDDTRGVEFTLVYVTEMGARGGEPRPGAIVLSSDPSNPHFQRKSSASVKLHKLTQEEMAALLQDLQALGFDGLPWTEQPYDAQIGAERAFYGYRAGKRVRVQKHLLDDGARQAFTAIERRIIGATMTSR